MKSRYHFFYSKLSKIMELIFFHYFTFKKRFCTNDSPLVKFDFLTFLFSSMFASAPCRVDMTNMIILVDV